MLRFGQRPWTWFAAVAVCFVAVARAAFNVLPTWRAMPGWEARMVAEALAGGHGFSFPGRDRWLFDPDMTRDFFPTAWMDPIYPSVLAALMWMFGDYYRLAAALLNLFLLAATFMLTYRVSERLMGSQAALVATMVLALVSVYPDVTLGMHNTMLATVAILIAANALISFTEAPSIRRCAALGASMGLMALTCPSTQLFLPLSAGLIWVMRIGGDRVRARSYALVAFAVAAAIVLPWTVRNYAQFSEFVPVRTGSGQIMFTSMVATGATVDPASLGVSLEPPWRAKSAGEAVYLANYVHDRREALELFQMEYAHTVGGTRYEALNEVQRDAWFLGETKRYISANLALSMQLAVMNLKRFILIDHEIGVWLCGLAAIAMLIAIQQRSSAAIVLSSWAAAYAAPFLFVCAFFNRYRAPIDPVLVILAVYGVTTAFAKFPTMKSIGTRSGV